MRAGALRHKLLLQSYTESQDNAGMVTESWSTYATVYGRVSPMASAERKLGPQTIGATMHEIEIRNNSTVDTKHRVVFGSRNFYIENIVRPDERNIRILLQCEERL